MAAHKDDRTGADNPDLAPTSKPVAQPEAVLVSDPSAEVVGVEPEGVQARGLIAVAFVMFLTITVAVLVLFQWTNLEVQKAEVEAVAASGTTALREAEAKAAGLLEQYQYDATNDAYRMPIDHAIDRMVLEGYQQRDGAAFSPELRLGQ